jgi:hypothetical protein
MRTIPKIVVRTRASPDLACTREYYIARRFEREVEGRNTREGEVEDCNIEEARERSRVEEI